MKKLSLIILLALFLILTLSSCGPDSNEVDSQVYIVALGCDKGVSNKIRLTIQFPTYKGGGGGSNSSGGGGGGSGSGSDGQGGGGFVEDTIVQTVEAPSILEGINLLNSSTTRKISLVHTKIIVFSEALAREGVESYLSPISRFRETRRIMSVIVCQTTAEDYIRENRTLVGESTAKSIELSIQLSNTSGYFPNSNFNDFYTAALSPYRQPYAIYASLNDFSSLPPNAGTQESSGPLVQEPSMLPGKIPRKGDRRIELVGTAIFDGAKMVGTLNSDETRYFLMVIGKFEKGFLTLNDKNAIDKAIPLDLRLGRSPKIIASFKGGKPVININLNIEADIGAIQSRIHYENLDKIEDLNNQLKEVIKKGVSATIKKTQDQFNTDIFAFGRNIAWNFATVQEFEEYNWLKHYKDAKINVDVEANVRRGGLMFESSPVRNSKETIKSEGD